MRTDSALALLILTLSGCSNGSDAVDTGTDPTASVTTNSSVPADTTSGVVPTPTPAMPTGPVTVPSVSPATGETASMATTSGSSATTTPSSSATTEPTSFTSDNSTAEETLVSSDSTTSEDTASGSTEEPELGAEYFSDWPAGADPREVGLKLANLFASQASDGEKHYKEACAWYGAAAIAALLGEQQLLQTLASRYTPYRTSYAELLASTGHVDNNVFGIVPLEMSMHFEDDVYLTDGVALADHQQTNINQQIRYAIDDMFMITGLQVQASRATGELKYINLAASTMVLYLNRLQQADGTFHHHEDVRVRWGRGNGWVASGMTELMRDLAPDNANYPTIRAGYEKMMNGLLSYQIASGDGEGLWKQIIDDNTAQNWPETSGSAMFAYAMVSGVRNGWLDAEVFGPAARKAWIGLVARLEPDGKLRDVSDWMWNGMVEDGPYLQRQRVTGDNHGQAPMMWTAAALIR